MRRLTFVGLASFLLAATVLADDPTPGRVLIAHVEGRQLDNGQMWYELDAGPVATRAIRMYSEPSHTRVAMVVDPTFLHSASGAAWMNSLSGDVLQDVTFATSPLADAHPRFQQTAPPATDTWIGLWVYGNYEGVDEDRLVSQQVIGTERYFAASLYLVPGVHPQIERCCNCHNGTEACKECIGFWNCCYCKDLCSIYCPAEICPAC